jgi:hypothetical protein
MRKHTGPGIQDFSFNSSAFGKTVRHQRRMLHIRENVKRDCTRLPRGLKRMLCRQSQAEISDTISARLLQRRGQSDFWPSDPAALGILEGFPLISG